MNIINMKKIPDYLESPVDNFLYVLVEKVAPTFHKWGFSPNMITTLGNIATLFSAYALYNQLYVVASFFFIVSYMFDCLDGFVARTYNLVSKFGDFYDHISDTAKLVIISYMLYRINPMLFLATLPIMVITLLLMCSYLAYQEKFYADSKSSYTLSFLDCFCFASDDKRDLIRHMAYTRYFGCGTFTAIMAIIIALYYPAKK